MIPKFRWKVDSLDDVDEAPSVGVVVSFSSGVFLTLVFWRKYLTIGFACVRR